MAGLTLMIFTTGNRVMKPIVEFTIAETRCRIVPAPVRDGSKQLLELHARCGGSPTRRR